MGATQLTGSVVHRNIHRTLWINCDPAVAQGHSGPIAERGIRRPVSRVLCRPRCRERGGHSSGPTLAGRFSRPTRIPQPYDRPTGLLRRGVPIRSCSWRGLPCRPCYQRRGGLLPHPFTLSPDRGPRWFAFCGAIPGLAPGGRYPPPCRRGARTFLDAEAPRPPGRLIRGHM